MIRVHSPAPKFVGDTSLELIAEGDRVALYEAMRREPDLVGATFIFSGESAAEEDEVIRRTSGGHDRHGKPFPIPADVYQKIRTERARPLLALTLWDVATANDPSLLAIAHTIATCREPQTVNLVGRAPP